VRKILGAHPISGGPMTAQDITLSPASTHVGVVPISSPAGAVSFFGADMVNPNDGLGGGSNVVWGVASFPITKTPLTTTSQGLAPPGTIEIWLKNLSPSTTYILACHLASGYANAVYYYHPLSGTLSGSSGEVPMTPAAPPQYGNVETIMPFVTVAGGGGTLNVFQIRADSAGATPRPFDWSFWGCDVQSVM
jgi:hypothetical protein